MGSRTINGESHQVVIPFDSTGEPAKNQIAFRGFASFNRPANSDPYSAGDCVGAAGAGGAVIKLAGIGRAGAHYEVQSVQITMSGTAVPANMAGGFRVHFFTAQPASLSDGDQFVANPIDRRIYLDSIDVPTLELIGGGFLTKTNKTDKLSFQSVSEDIWVSIVTLADNGFTPIPSAFVEINVRGVVTGVPTKTVGTPPYATSPLFLVNPDFRDAEQLPEVSWDFTKRTLTDSIRGLTIPFTRTVPSTFNQADNTTGLVGINEPVFSYSGGVSRGLEIWEPRTNIYLNSDAPGTQVCTVTAAVWTLSFKGTGTITLTGASTAGPLVGTGVNNRVVLSFTPSAGALTLTPSGSITEVQLELGAGASPYNRTEGLPAIRTGDVCLLTDLSWYVPGGGFYVEYISPPTGVIRNIVTLSDGSAGNRVAVLSTTASIVQSLTLVDAASSGRVDGNTVTSGNPIKAAMRFLLNDLAISVNGSSLVTDTSVLIPEPNQLRIGASATGTLQACTTIGRVDYYAPGIFQSFLQRMSA